MKKKWTVLIVILSLIALLLGAKFWFFPSPNQGGNQPQNAPLQASINSGKPAANTKQAPKKGPVPVRVAVLEQRDWIQDIAVLGQVRPADEVDLIPEVSGRLLELKIKDGANVRKGQVLAVVNNTELRAINTKLKIQLKSAQIKWARTQKLWASQSISQEELENAQLTVEQAQADLELNLAQLDKYTIKAPFAAQVGLINVSVGAMVNTSFKIARLQRTDKLKLDFALPEVQAQSLKIGQHLPILGPDAQTLQTTISALETGLDPTTRTRLIRSEIQNATHSGLLPGSYVQLKLKTTQKNTLSVPSTAITADIQGSKIWRVQQGKAFSTLVNILTRSGTDVLIQPIANFSHKPSDAAPQNKQNSKQAKPSDHPQKTLSAGDTVITNGLLNLKPGVEVKILEAK